MKRWLLHAGLAVLGLHLLAGCSAGTRIAYNNLDTLVAWQLSDYVELDAPQKAAFKTSFQTLWDWHRQTQLPAYAVDLRAMAASVAKSPLTRDSIESFFGKAERHGETLGRHAGDGLVSLLPTLSDAQVMQLLAQQRKDIDKDERKHGDETPDERRKRFQKRIAEAADRWIGPLNAAQKNLVDSTWQEGLATLPTAAMRRQHRLDDLQPFADLLSHRRGADFPQRLRALSEADDDANDPKQAADTKRQREMTIGILIALDDAQRKRLNTRLLDLAEDCEALASEAVAHP